MEIKRIQYPSEEFYHFGQKEGAVKVPNDRVEQWVNDTIQSVKKQLEDGIDSPYAFTASGDTFVISFYSQDVQDDVFNDSNYFVTIVAKNYEEGNFFIENIKEGKDTREKICSNNKCVYADECSRFIKNVTTEMYNVDITRMTPSDCEERN